MHVKDAIGTEQNATL